MKNVLIIGLMALAGTTIAAPFEFQKQVGSAEYDYTERTRGMHFAPVEPSNTISSLSRWTLEANVDGIALNDFHGTIEKSGPTRISLYEAMRGSPEATGYQGYYAQFPVESDEAAIAAEIDSSDNPS